MKDSEGGKNGIGVKVDTYNPSKSFFTFPLQSAFLVPSKKRKKK